jgi:monothiol glutaredoxin
MGLIDRVRRRLGLSARTALTPPSPVARPRVHVPLAAPSAPEPRSPRGDAEPGAWIAQVVREHPVVLFMKGSPDSPSCGFSASASSMLAGHGARFHHVDVLLDPEVREAVKAYSSWPTLPQVYVGGEFLGGADILRELHESGELATRLAAVAPATPA